MGRRMNAVDWIELIVLGPTLGREKFAWVWRLGCVGHSHPLSDICSATVTTMIYPPFVANDAF